MKVETYSCNICGTMRGPAVPLWDWFVVRTQNEDERFLAYAWGKGCPASPMALHICSEKCLHIVVSQWCNAQRKAATA